MATTLLRGTQPILVTRRGKIVGFFKRELFYTLSSEVRRMVRERGLTEKAIVADFEKVRKARRRR